MATTTRVLDANVSGTVYTSDLNGALQAIDTAHAGPTAPTDEVANGKFWLDTSGGVHELKVRRNSGWYPVVSNQPNTITADYDNARVGVGTDTPSYRLDVHAPSGTVARVSNGSTGATPSTSHAELVVESNEANLGIQLLGNTTSNQRINFGDTTQPGAGSVTYDHTNNYMSFATNNVERVRINSSGNLGLKETSPSADLHISDTSVVNVRLEETAGSSYTLIQTDNAGTLLSADPGNSRASTALRFAVDGSERMRVSGSGNIGIGTSNPDEKLTVLGNIRTTGSIEVAGTIYSPVNTDSIRFYGGSNGDGSNIGLWGSSHASNPNLLVLDADQHRFRSASAAEHMRITSAGDVGIGTTFPTDTLHVNGGIRSDSGIVRAGDYTADGVKFVAGRYSTNVPYFAVSTAGSGTRMEAGVADSRELRFTGGGDINFFNSGDVGIGTLAPSEKLEVNGTVKATGFNLGGTDLNLPIGDGQQWYNDGSVTSGTAYQNTTGRPIQVMLSFQGAGNKTIGFSTNGSTWIETLNIDNDGSDHDANASFIVPAGHYWRAVGSWTFSRRNVLR